METNEFFALLFLLFNLFCFLFKDKYILCNKAWYVLKAFWIALAVVLAIGYVKDQFKNK
jgi:hypothetical protein